MKPVFPCRVSQPFADPGTYASNKDSHGPAGHHTGIDYGSAAGSSINRKIVRAILSGEVVISDFNDTMGNWVGVYNHHNDLLVTYWHLAERHVSLGEWVLAYHDLGLVGDTGNSTAPHLHLQVNRGRDFDYHGHLDPQEAFDISPTRGEAKKRYKELDGVHPADEKA
jgi:murein DD-endopeptidase MepM/ murein hydrolase activator NlpD